MKSLQLKTIDKVYILQLLAFAFIVTGVLPRESAIFLAIGLIIYLALAPLEEATIFFIRSIPFFIAIPITENYDNLNTWRILAIILFLKLAHITGLKYFLRFKDITRSNKVLLTIFGLMVLSFIPAIDKISALTRIIFFANFSLVGLVIYKLVAEKEGFAKRVIKNIAVPTIIVALVGLLQVVSTYFIDIYQFMRIWGEGVQMRQFGVLWSEIAVRLGNTWFAYFGDQLSLRVFSLFPDSHSFPQFLLLGLSSIFALALLRVLDKNQNGKLKNFIKTRANMSVLWIPFVFLMAILSGTRGIWAASLGVLIIAMGVIFWTYKKKNNEQKNNIFKYITLYLLCFFLLFSVAYPIFVSPQFLLAKDNLGLFKERIKSIIDFGETSNSQRIEIWKASLNSIKERPFLGVGIGNFPVVLDQRVFLARAGSSAHNIYLHIASEIGLPALFLTILALWMAFKKTYRNFIKSKDNFNTIYFASTLLFLPWVLIYSLTDIALFDERSFLLFVTIFSLITAYDE